MKKKCPSQIYTNSLKLTNPCTALTELLGFWQDTTTKFCDVLSFRTPELIWATVRN
jgi:hypothetical protein